MLALAIESSTSHASLAIKKDSQILHQEFSDNPKTHSEFLNFAVEKSLKATGLELSQMDVFACTSGPGSFTGIRVASCIIKSFALVFKKPIFVTDSLDLLAAAAYRKNPKLDQVLCLMNAHKNMAYTFLFEKNKKIGQVSSLKIEDINNLPHLRQALGLGDGFSAYDEALRSNLCIRDQQYWDFPDAATLCDLALEALLAGKTIEWNLYKPLYIRDSEAEEVLKLKTKSAKNLT